MAMEPEEYTREMEPVHQLMAERTGARLRTKLIPQSDTGRRLLFLGTLMAVMFAILLISSGGLIANH